MAAIKGKGNRSTELAFIKILKKHKITGWNRHYKKLPGTPDFIFRSKRLAIFLDGCFWHGCRKCFIAPKTNSEFWDNKIKDNIQRDRKNRKLIHEMDWQVIKFFEHTLKNERHVVNRLNKYLNNR